MIVERRDQVLIAPRVPPSCAAEAFLRRLSSTNGPFQTERAMLALPLSRMTRPDDHLVGRFVLAGTMTLGRLAPRGDRMTTARSTAFATAVRMVDRVLGDAAGKRTITEPAVATGLGQILVGVVRIGHRTDSAHAIGVHVALLARIQADHHHA